MAESWGEVWGHPRPRSPLEMNLNKSFSHSRSFVLCVCWAPALPGEVWLEFFLFWASHTPRQTHPLIVPPGLSVRNPASQREVLRIWKTREGNSWPYWFDIPRNGVESICKPSFEFVRPDGWRQCKAVQQQYHAASDWNANKIQPMECLSVSKGQCWAADVLSAESNLSCWWNVLNPTCLADMLKGSKIVEDLVSWHEHPNLRKRSLYLPVTLLCLHTF